MLRFQDLSFIELEKDKVKMLRVSLYKYLFREFARSEIVENAADYSVKQGKIGFKGISEKAAEKKFMRFFGKHKKDLVYSLNGNKAIFVDEDMGLPMIGLNFLGIVDKGSEIIEVKPITGCNADCDFCSVDEGLSSRKKVDFVVEEDYLVSQLADLLAFKAETGLEIWINPHGEPTLYGKLAELCDDVLCDPHVSKVSIITNGLLLDKEMVDALNAIAKKRKKEIKLAVSVSDLRKTGNIMGKGYGISAVLANLEYAAVKLPLSITPVWIKGANDAEIKKIVELSKELSKKSKKALDKGAAVSIQKFSSNKYGRNPIKEKGWEEFFSDLRQLEKETSVKLTFELGKLKETKELPTLCEKGDVIAVRVLCEGRNPRDKIGVFETRSGNRAVALIGCNATKGLVKTKVVQNKHNMIVGC